MRSVPPAIAGGCAALKQVGAVTAKCTQCRILRGLNVAPRLRTHPLSQVVLTSSKFEAKPEGAHERPD